MVAHHHRHPTTLVFANCPSRREFAARLAEELRHGGGGDGRGGDFGDGDGDGDGDDDDHGNLLANTIHQAAVARHIRVLITPTVSHLRALLTTFSLTPGWESPDDSTIPPPPSVYVDSSQGLPPRMCPVCGIPEREALLVAYGLVDAHRGTSEWSSQGVGATVSILVDACAVPRGLRAVVVEPRERRRVKREEEEKVKDEDIDMGREGPHSDESPEACHEDRESRHEEGHPEDDKEDHTERRHAADHAENDEMDRDEHEEQLGAEADAGHRIDAEGRRDTTEGRDHGTNRDRHHDTTLGSRQMLAENCHDTRMTRDYTAAADTRRSDADHDGPRVPALTVSTSHLSIKDEPDHAIRLDTIEPLAVQPPAVKPPASWLDEGIPLLSGGRDDDADEKLVPLGRVLGRWFRLAVSHTPGLLRKPSMPPPPTSPPPSTQPIFS
jgi:hypothetical protein